MGKSSLDAPSVAGYSPWDFAQMATLYSANPAGYMAYMMPQQPQPQWTDPAYMAYYQQYTAYYAAQTAAQPPTPKPLIPTQTSEASDSAPATTKSSNVASLEHADLAPDADFSDLAPPDNDGASAEISPAVDIAPVRSQQEIEQELIAKRKEVF